MEIKEYVKPVPKVKPLIYAYILNDNNGKQINEGYIKIGYTTRHNYSSDEENAMERIKEQVHVTGLIPSLLGVWPAIKNNGTFFTDKDVHKKLKIMHKKQLNEINDSNEWYECTKEDIDKVVAEIKTGKELSKNRTQTFKMRPEQAEAVRKTKEYFLNADLNDKNPKFLWNAKMRFGKTFTSYQLAKEMNMKRVLILTFKPAVQDSWKEDLNSHIDFEGWQFISEEPGKRIDEQYFEADHTKPIVCFGSFQDFLQIDKTINGVKPKNAWVHNEKWDLVIFDEYHFGAWRDNAKHLFEKEDEDKMEELDPSNKEDNISALAEFNETYLPIKTKYYLFLSGTPFRALNNGEFLEDQVFSWTYTDEQREKQNWNKENGPNPYEMMPQIKLFTYQIDDVIQQENIKEFDEFDLNKFFEAEGSGLVDKKASNPAHFKNEGNVQKWLNIMRGNFKESMSIALKENWDKIPLPYQDPTLIDVLKHTIWYLPNVAACEAMYNLLQKSQNSFYCNEKEGKYVICCAGKNVGNGTAALSAITPYMNNPLEKRSITLTCGKLTTGVTVKPWTGIFMLRNIKTPESYFQAAFRVQSPWEILDEKGLPKNLKPECYIFDFAINRTLRQIADYSCSLQVNDDSPEKKINEFIKYLPVLSFDGAFMKEANAQDILDWSINGTTATLLARKWKDASLINISNDILGALIEDKEALKIFDKIKSWRNLREDIDILIKKSKILKEAKTTGSTLSPDGEPIDKVEKDIRNKRKEIQDKLMHFMSRLPVFMYMTDCREQSIKDIINTYEPDLFKLVTGLEVSDFNKLVEVGVFDSIKMNAACGAFRKYEDSSMTYTGIDKHKGEEKGLFDMVISPEEYKEYYKKINKDPGI